jgi:hypothetical protein
MRGPRTQNSPHQRWETPSKMQSAFYCFKSGIIIKNNGYNTVGIILIWRRFERISEFLEQQNDC